MFRLPGHVRGTSVRELWRKGDRLLRKGQTDKAIAALQNATNSSSPLDRHYAYVKLIRLYRLRINEHPEELDTLLDLCQKDIELFPDFYEAWMVEYLNNVPTPYFPSFSVLAEIYEAQGKIAEAIAVCELALGYGLSDTTGEDYPEKLERLLAKLDNHT